MKACRRRLAAALVLVTLLGSLPGAQGPLSAQVAPPSPAPAPPPPTAPVNLDFEQGELGQVPTGWTLGRRAATMGYTAVLVDEKPQGGSRCVRIAPPGSGGPWVVSDLTQTLDAASYRGKRIRLRAAVRFESAADPGAKGNGRLLVRTDLPRGRVGFRDFMADRQITSPDWQKVDVSADVDPEALRITFGAALYGSGRLWVDSFTLEVLGEAGAGNEPARALTDRGLENLAAFSRLLGYVRYFHPSDQAEKAHWERLAVAGVQTAEDARDAQDLARRLEGFFRSVAPTLRVFPTGGQPASPVDFARPSGAAAPKVVAWKHYGVDTRGNPASLYWSRRINDQDPPAPQQGVLARELNARPVRGKKIRLRARVRTQLDEARGEIPARMYFGIQQASGGSFSDDGSKNPITSREWQTLETVTDVPETATLLSFGFRLPGGGKVWIDDLDFEVVSQDGKAGSSAGLVADPGFEKGAVGSTPEGWSVPGSDSGYSAVIQGDASGTKGGKGGKSLLFAYAPPPPPVLPKPEEVFQADLPGGVSVRLPIALYADAAGTLPRPGAEARVPRPAKPDGFPYSGNDRATRLANVALAWNVFQHFYPYFDVIRTDWHETLRKSLRSAATDKDQGAFVGTLNRLVADLQDGHGNAGGPGMAASYSLPMMLEVIEDTLVVTDVDPEKAPGVERGSVVLAWNGRPVREVIDGAASLISAPTPGWRSSRLIGALGDGEENEEVRLELQSPAGKVATVNVRRMLPSTALPRFTEPRPEKLAEIRPGIFYLDAERLSNVELDEALDKLAAARGVIVDVRGYPQLSTDLLGHLLDAPAISPQWHVPVATRPDREGMTFDFSNWSVEPAQPRFKGKVAFLTDGRAVSYAETFMGIVEHFKLGEIVGEPTAGTNGNVNPFTLPGGYTVLWTGLKVLKQDGSVHHGVGILPTVPVPRTIQGVVEGRDEVLEKGIEIVSR